MYGWFGWGCLVQHLALHEKMMGLVLVPYVVINILWVCLIFALVIKRRFQMVMPSCLSLLDW